MTRERSSADHFGIVAVASSAGGIPALSAVLGGLGPELPVPVLLVQHLDPRHRTVLDQVLARRTALVVKIADARERVRPGTVYIAPPGQHLLVDSEGVLSLSTTEPVHFVRPSADLLFESVARAYGPAAIACVLTGTGRDGATGVGAVRAHGGTVIVQDPKTADFAGMPQSAVDTGAVDFVLPLGEIAAVVRGLVEAERQ